MKTQDILGGRGRFAILVSALALVGCGGAPLKNAADDAVRGTAVNIKSVKSTPGGGSAVAEGPSGEKLFLDLVKDGGDFVLQGCQNALGTQGDCRYLDLE